MQFEPVAHAFEPVHLVPAPSQPAEKTSEHRRQGHHQERRGIAAAPRLFHLRPHLADGAGVLPRHLAQRSQVALDALQAQRVLQGILRRLLQGGPQGGRGRALLRIGRHLRAQFAAQAQGRLAFDREIERLELQSRRARARLRLLRPLLRCRPHRLAGGTRRREFRCRARTGARLGHGLAPAWARRGGCGRCGLGLRPGRGRGSRSRLRTGPRLRPRHGSRRGGQRWLHGERARQGRGRLVRRWRLGQQHEAPRRALAAAHAQVERHHGLVDRRAGTHVQHALVTGAGLPAHGGCAGHARLAIEHFRAGAWLFGAWRIQRHRDRDFEGTPDQRGAMGPAQRQGSCVPRKEPAARSNDQGPGGNCVKHRAAILGTPDRSWPKEAARMRLARHR